MERLNQEVDHQHKSVPAPRQEPSASPPRSNADVSECQASVIVHGAVERSVRNENRTMALLRYSAIVAAISVSSAVLVFSLLDSESGLSRLLVLAASAGALGVLGGSILALNSNRRSKDRLDRLLKSVRAHES